MNKEKSKLKRQPPLFLSKCRKLIALGLFVLVTGIAVRHVVVGGGPAGYPELCAFCPMGAISSLYVYLVHGQFLHHIHPTSFVVLGAVFFVTFLSRRAFCGWICPFGTLQEWIARVGKKLFRRRVEPPAWLDRNLRYLKYVVLLLVVGGSWFAGTLVFRRYDPYLAFYDFGDSLSITWPGYVILIVVIVGAVYRAFVVPICLSPGSVAWIALEGRRNEDFPRRGDLYELQSRHLPVLNGYQSHARIRSPFRRMHTVHGMRSCVSYS